PYVSDFGLAKFAEELEEGTPALTRSTTVLGTPQYLAPEVALTGPGAATTAADIYSLGAILYELLAGQPPFKANSFSALLKSIAEDEPLPLAAVKSKIKNLKSKIESVPRDLEVISL